MPDSKTQSQGNSGNQGGRNNDSSQGGGSENRGFAAMDPERQREIASEGGKASHEGPGHEFTSEEAREAGKMSHKNDDGGSGSGSGGNSGGGNKDGGSGSGSGGSGGRGGK